MEKKETEEMAMAETTMKKKTKEKDWRERES